MAPTGDEIPNPGYRYSVSTLLAAMTLAALLMGTVVWWIRSPKINRVRIGMTVEEVEKALGEPLVIFTV